MAAVYFVVFLLARMSEPYWLDYTHFRSLIGKRLRMSRKSRYCVGWQHLMYKVQSELGIEGHSIAYSGMLIFERVRLLMERM